MLRDAPVYDCLRSLVASTALSARAPCRALFRRYDCSETPPCGCFDADANASSASSVGAWYVPRYLDVCGNSSAVHGLSALPLDTSFASLAASRHEACTQPGVPRERFAIVATLTLALGVTAWLAVPPARTAGGSKHVPSTLGLGTAMLTTFSQRPFQVYAFSAAPRRALPPGCARAVPSARRAGRVHAGTPSRCSSRRRGRRSCSPMSASTSCTSRRWGGFWAGF